MGGRRRGPDGEAERGARLLSPDSWPAGPSEAGLGSRDQPAGEDGSEPRGHQQGRRRPGVARREQRGGPAAAEPRRGGAPARLHLRAGRRLHRGERRAWRRPAQLPGGLRDGRRRGRWSRHADVIPVLMKSCAKEGRSCWFIDRKFTISITAILFILPLSIPKEIGFQKYASCLSVIGTWYVTIVVIIKYFWPDQVISPEEITTSPASWVSVFNAMPTICFGFQCHVSSVPIFNSMKCPQVRSWGVVVTAAMVIALFVYMGTGVCGFLTFGESVQQDVLLSYPSDDIPVAIARAFIILSVLTSYPILHFCGRTVLEGLWLRYKGETVDEDVAQERRRRLLQTFCWFLLTLLLALFIPDIGRVISVIGGLAACFIFVFPGLCLIQTKLSEVQGAGGASWWMVVSYGIFMVVLGTFIFGQTTANAISMDLRK
ncbi:sodium-coupled neutral amino acid transporter 7 isoform 2-T2 [Vipera latastei]